MFEVLRDELSSSMVNSYIQPQIRTLSTHFEFLHMQQLHFEHCQLRHSCECTDHCFELVHSERVVVAVGLLCRAAETQFDQLLYAAQLLDSFVGDAAVV
jgi:hypothetical protein